MGSVDLRRHTDLDENDIARFEYGYDKVHNRKHVTRLHDGGIGDVYSYDDVYRLVKVNYDVPDSVNDTGTPSSVVDFNYDGLGNRESVETDGAPAYYILSNMNEYDDLGGVTQLHDNNDNLTEDGRYLYTWDSPACAGSGESPDRGVLNVGAKQSIEEPNRKQRERR